MLPFFKMTTRPPQEIDWVGIALAEDIGDGDVTSSSFVHADLRAEARIVAREPVVVSGIDMALEVFRRVDGTLVPKATALDGDAVETDGELLLVRGGTRSILTAERCALNFLQRLSGIATLTRKYVEAVAGTGVKILDTRKTTPGWRALEKAAVRHGGGANHRFGLFDRAMVKDNHLLALEMSELQGAIDRFRDQHPGCLVEFEADRFDQVEFLLGLRGIDILLLDNMSLEEMRRCVDLGGGRVEFEASGRVNLDSVRSIAETGVDSISIGALTHSARAVDLSLELQRDRS